MSLASRVRLTVAAAAMLAACSRSSDKESGAADADIANGNDPLRALTGSAQSTRYISTYWQTQAEQNRLVWNQAVRYCETQRSAVQGAKPNCAAVFSAQFEIAGRAPTPKYRRQSAAEMETRP